MIFPFLFIYVCLFVLFFPCLKQMLKMLTAKKKKFSRQFTDSLHLDGKLQIPTL